MRPDAERNLLSSMRSLLVLGIDMTGDRTLRDYDLDALRRHVEQVGWVKDARVSRRFPDTLVIDIVERTPAALWQNQGQLALIDAPIKSTIGVIVRRDPRATT